jgi:hypothetical protein
MRLRWQASHGNCSTISAGVRFAITSVPVCQRVCAEASLDTSPIQSSTGTIFKTTPISRQRRRPSPAGSKRHEMGKQWGRSDSVRLSKVPSHFPNLLILVPEAGIEPAWTFWVRGILSPLRLPISPLRQQGPQWRDFSIGV